MKNKPLYEPNDLQLHFKEILRVLLPGTANVNYIFRHIRQTGLPGSGYKRKILEAIDYLEETGFIVDISGYKRYKSGQKRTKQLTLLGREMAELIDSIEEYYTSFSELVKATKEKLYIIPPTSFVSEKIVKYFLGPRGADVKLYRFTESPHARANKLRIRLSPAHFFNTIVARYFLIMSKIVLNDRDIVKKDILDGIIMNAISKHLLFFTQEVNDLNYITDEKITVDSAFNGPIEDTIKDTFEGIVPYYVVDNLVVEDEVMNVLSSILSMSKLSSGFIDDCIKECHDVIREYEKLNYHNRPGREEYYREWKKLLALYEKQKMKNQIVVSSPSNS
jgi:hypothetical protein